MSTPNPNETDGLAWAKVLVGVGVLILGTSLAFAGGPWWQSVTAAVAVVLGVVLAITGIRSLATRRRQKLAAGDEERGDV